MTHMTSIQISKGRQENRIFHTKVVLHKPLHNKTRAFRLIAGVVCKCQRNLSIHKVRLTLDRASDMKDMMRVNVTKAVEA
jgi:hypothetical protein